MNDVLNKIIALQASLVLQGFSANFTICLEDKAWWALVDQVIQNAKYITRQNFQNAKSIDINGNNGVITVFRGNP